MNVGDLGFTYEDFETVWEKSRSAWYNNRNLLENECLLINCSMLSSAGVNKCHNESDKLDRACRMRDIETVVQVRPEPNLRVHDTR